MPVRFRFSKLGRIRFTSQRDVARMWERALRRADLPVAHTRGFSPRPRLSFGLALPTGCESLAEYVDVVLDPDRPPVTDEEVGGLAPVVSRLLPEGIEVDAVGMVDRGAVSLQQEVTSCTWTIWFRAVTYSALGELVASMLGREQVLIVRERKGTSALDDLRASVLDLALLPPTEAPGAPTAEPVVGLVAELATRPRGVRPGELVSGLVAMGAGGGPARSPVLDRACRTQQWIECDGERREPLGGHPGAAGRAPYALERAS
ncbi:MAG: TIGR03936 family radical SAM-associated protein [Acidimicrobiales bacterium]